MSVQEDRGWSCTAYGPEVPALCFVESVDGACEDLAQCTARMTAERQRVFRRMQELAAHGDPVFADLADDFDSPDDLLNADRNRPDQA